MFETATKQARSCTEIRYWCIISSDFEMDDTETHDKLLKMIVELYQTIK